MTKRTEVANETMRESRPFLKWAGGKQQLLPELLDRVPGRFRAYHEPFVGGGALFFALRGAGRLRAAHLSDANRHLIRTYRAIRDRVDEVIERLEMLHYDKDEYCATRALDPETLSDAARAARFIYLNRTCFNGLYRENASGRFNVPMGRYVNPTICQTERLHAAARALQEVELHCESFEAVTERAKKGDLVYFDPPYVPLNATSSFTAYDKGGFGVSEHRRLARVFAMLAERGVHVVLSNADAPLVTELYGEQRIERVLARRHINSKAGGRGAIAELIITPGAPAGAPADRQIPLV